MSIRTRLIAAGVCAALGFGAAWMVQGWRYGAEIAGIERDKAQELADRNQAWADRESLARAVEHARQTKIQEVIDVANNQTAQANADAIASAAVANSMRAELARLRGRKPASNPAVTGAGPAAADPIGVLAVVLGEIDDRSGILAEYSDKSRIAGLACEAAYDGVRAVPGRAQ